ncbi:MAG: glycosyltransferase family 4 protein [Aquabacterium sp.]
MSGVGNYVFGLCCELDKLLPDAQFFVYARHPAEVLCLPSARWVVRHEVVPLWRRIPSFLWLKTRGLRLCQQDRLSHFWAGRTLHPHLPAPVKTIVTVHDLNHLVVPETMQRSTRWSHQLWFAADVRSADVVLTNSQGTASRLVRALGVKAQAVIHPGISEHYRQLDPTHLVQAREGLAQLGIRQPYVLSVGTLEPRKNVALVLDAFMSLKSQGQLPAHQLVLAGARGWQNQALATRIQEAKGAGVLMPGYVPNELMPALYGLADTLVCASSYEGFGMPVLEARACGTTPVVTDVPELLEAAGGQGLVVQDTSVQALAKVMQRACVKSSEALSFDHASATWSARGRNLLPWFTS